jgi:nucleotide-binding universal stress UspA family protein
MEGKNFKESHEAQIKRAGKYLSKIQAQLKLGGVNITAEVLVGSAAETIIDFAKQKKVDLIIMTTNVGSTVSRLMIGSVADRVMRYSRLPVLMVRPVATEC